MENQAKRLSSRPGFRVLALTAVAFVVASAAACGTDEPAGQEQAEHVTQAPGELVDEGTPTTGGRVVMAVTAETNGWNPATAQWADAGNFVGSSFMEPLFVYNSIGEPTPWLAESSTPSNEYRQWTVTLREGISFHDGTPLTAQAAADSFEFAVNSPEALASVALTGLVNDVRALDERTFVVELNVQWGAFLNVLAGPSGYVMAPSMLAREDRGRSNPVGTGPYVFESWTPDQSVQTRANPDYWGGPCALADPGEEIEALCTEAGVPLGQRNGPFLEGIEFRPMVDSQARANALEAGDVNLILTTRAADAARLGRQFTVVRDFDSEQTFVMLNTAEPPFDNIHARRALAYGTDRAAIVDQISAGEPVRSDTSPFEETSRWGGLAPDETGYPAFNPERAREELAAYTAATGNATLSFDLSGLTPVEDIAIMQTLQDQWSQLGIEASIETLEQTAYILKLVQGDFQAAYFRNYGWPDPDSMYVFWAEKTAQPPLFINFSRFYTQITENAVGWGRVSREFGPRKDAYTHLVRERNEAAVDIWLFNTPYSLIAEPEVRGLNWFRTTPYGNYVPKPWIGGLWLAS